MAVNVQFVNQKTGTPTPLQDVDREIYSHFQADYDPLQWYKGWFSSIGLLLALDLRGEDLRNQLRSGWTTMPDRLYELTEILDFIENTYEIKSWRDG